MHCGEGLKDVEIIKFLFRILYYLYKDCIVFILHEYLIYIMNQYDNQRDFFSKNDEVFYRISDGILCFH